jgi:hypothetical protein
VTEEPTSASIRAALEATEGEDTCPTCLKTKSQYDAAYYANYRNETATRPAA